MTRIFANPDVVSRSWYPTVRSATLRAGRLAAFDLGRRRLVVYRGTDGRARAIDARCAHLGADLGGGRVDGTGVRCAFHGWKFGPEGRCVDAPGQDGVPDRSVRTYPTLERWGLVWIFNGPTPLFDLPGPDAEHRWRAVKLRPQIVGCHPHLVLANGLDTSHYDVLHDMAFTKPPRCSTSHPFEVSLDLCGRPRSRFWQAVSGTRSRDIVARFRTIGGSLAWSDVTAPIRFGVLFSGRPDRHGRCVTRTIFFLPSLPGVTWLRAAALMTVLLHDDRRVLDSIDFRPAFSEADRPLRTYADTVESLGAW